MIKPIETYYNGYRFRSRLEARWAVFFDSLGIKYEYEPEGFELEDGTWYLPDFYLKDFNTWVEVKGVMDEKSMHKIEMFAKGLPNGQQLWVLMDIPNPDEVLRDATWFYDMDYKDAWEMYFGSDEFEIGYGWDQPYVPCVCPVCQKIGIEFDGRGARVCEHSEGDKSYSSDAPIIVEAYKKARQARFEHGQEG